MAQTRSKRPQGEVPENFNPRDYLANLWKIPFIEDKEPEKIDIALRERIKELNCLYGIARLAERHHDSMDDFLKGPRGASAPVVAVSRDHLRPDRP